MSDDAFQFRVARKHCENSATRLLFLDEVSRYYRTMALPAGSRPGSRPLL